MNFKKEYKRLLGIVKTNLIKEGKPHRNEDIAKTLGYNRSYFSQLLGDSGVVTEDHVNIFKLHYSKMLEKPTPDNAAGGDPANKDLSSLIESNLIMSRSIEKNTNNLAQALQMLKEKSVPVNLDVPGLVETLRQLDAKVNRLLKPQIDEAEEELKREAGRFVDDRDKEAFEIAQRLRESGRHGYGKPGKK